MPVFHTKTIEAILEPVAQQVHSQLEETQGGLANDLKFNLKLSLKH
jgi:hypothetical protein